MCTPCMEHGGPTRGECSCDEEETREMEGGGGECKPLRRKRKNDDDETKEFTTERLVSRNGEGEQQKT